MLNLHKQIRVTRIRIEVQRFDNRFNNYKLCAHAKLAPRVSRILDRKIESSRGLFQIWPGQ